MFTLRGYHIAHNNSKICEDINECTNFGHNCSQSCVNLEGTYLCKCKPGFEMLDERCIAKSESSTFVLFANGPDVRAIDLNQQHQSSLITGESRVQALDYDPVAGK